MKLKKLISSALVFVMLFTSMIALIPIGASAADEPTVSVLDADKVITDEAQIQEICDSYLEYNFDTAKEMLDYELEKGYLDYITYGDYALYLNRYTGFSYYVNNVTGQILTSNPIDPSYQTQEGSNNIVSVQEIVMSQLELKYFELSNTASIKTYDTLHWIREGSYPVVSKEGNGLAIEYILGSALDAFIAPSAMLLDTANEQLLFPMFEKLATLLEEKCGAFDAQYATSGLVSYLLNENEVFRTGSDEVYDSIKVRKILSALDSYALAALGGNKSNEDYKEIKKIITHLNIDIFSNYTVITPETANTVLTEKIAALAEGKNVILLSGATDVPSLTIIRKVDKAIKACCPDYTLDLVELHENEAGFVSTGVDVPYFKVTLEYNINSDGTLSATVPVNKIEYDNTIYALKEITPLKYFGAGDMDLDGYTFFPDGSGAIIEFDDFYYGSTSPMPNSAVDTSAKVYGADYSYANVTGAHREQVTMPVYGLVNEITANSLGASAALSSVRNGYFAIIEEGASLATLGYASGGGINKYMTAYAAFVPFPSDTYDLSQSISVSGLGSYTVVAPCYYTGDIKTTYTMLVDETINGAIDTEYPTFDSDYIGMAQCYRSFLESKGIIEKLEKEYSSLPLYIEALGSMDVMTKILSFPVSVSTPLTTFDDVAKMYHELSNAKATILAKAAASDAEADRLEEENFDKHELEIARLRGIAEEYRALEKTIGDIKNVNFRLTGFANGGMHFTYPAKVKWERSLGGSNGFKALLDTAKQNTDADSTLGIYPDFDFMYINNTAMFDGVSRRGTAACMVDNRYASKQTYNSVNQMFESLFALVVSSNSLDKLYSKFEKQYSKYAATGLSISTLGSDLNSNFDEDNPVVREESLNSVKAVLARMSEKYSLMTDKGNDYTLKYVDHILNASIDSSHLNSCSYAVPFFGMVLHGYVNYTSTPLNYSGSPDYDILRSIESGAGLYYILCVQNTNHLKEDSLLSSYYGIDYNNWFDKLVVQYAKVNGAIGNLQTHNITDHSMLYSERVIDEDEMTANYKNLLAEFFEKLDSTISIKIDLKLKEMREDGLLGAGLKFEVSEADVEAIIANAAERTNLTKEELNEKFGFEAELDALIANYTKQYASGDVVVTVGSDDIDYKTIYSYVTDSTANSENYVYTDFTCDNGNVVMVTYEKEIDGKLDTVVFILNYNVFSVKLKLDESIHANFAEYCDEDGYLTLDSYDFVKIQDKEGN